MAGRQCGRSSGGSRVGGALAAAAVGGAIAAGAVESANAARAAGMTTQEQTPSFEQTRTQEDMPMCRHVNLLSTTTGCCSMERQLWELSQILDYQNKILVELLQAVREQRRGEQ